MAKYLLPHATPRNIGSTESLTFQKCGNVFSIRNKSVPVDKKSIAQTINRQKFAALSSQWRDRSPAEKTSFQTERLNYPLVNSLGQTYYQPRNALFTGSNMNLKPQVFSSINLIPAVATPLTLSFGFSQADYGLASVFLTANPFVVPNDTVYNIFVTRFLQARPANVSSLEFILLKQFQPLQTTFTNIYTDFTALQGEWPDRIGQDIGWLVDAFSTLTGQRIGFYIDYITVTG